MPEQAASRMCAYRTCWREHAPNMLLCEQHAGQTRSDLTWVTVNADDLTGYRLNRAYGHRTDGPHGNSGSAPAPLREQLAVLLYESDDHDVPGLEPTLLGWARSLKLNLTARYGLATIARRIESCYRLWQSTATPVYAEDLHAIVRQLTRFTDNDDDVIQYGQCPAPGCTRALSAPSTAVEVKCPSCGNTWTVSGLKAQRHHRLIASGWMATQKDLITALKALGVEIKPATMRSWVHRSQLEQAGEDAFSNPIYRLHDAYRLAVKDNPSTTVTDFWTLIDNHGKDTK